MQTSKQKKSMKSIINSVFNVKQTNKQAEERKKN